MMIMPTNDVALLSMQVQGLTLQVHTLTAQTQVMQQNTHNWILISMLLCVLIVSMSLMLFFLAGAISGLTSIIKQMNNMNCSLNTATSQLIGAISEHKASAAVIMASDKVHKERN